MRAWKLLLLAGSPRSWGWIAKGPASRWSRSRCSACPSAARNRRCSGARRSDLRTWRPTLWEPWAPPPRGAAGSTAGNQSARAAKIRWATASFEVTRRGGRSKLFPTMACESAGCSRGGSGGGRSPRPTGRRDRHPRSSCERRPGTRGPGTAALRGGKALWRDGDRACVRAEPRATRSQTTTLEVKRRHEP